MKAAEELRSALERLLATARELNSQKEASIAQKQQLTQQLLAVLKEGKETARRLRAAAKAQLGTKNERLVEFQARPIRDRKGRRSTKKNPQPPVTPPAASPATDGKPAEPPPLKA